MTRYSRRTLIKAGAAFAGTSAFGFPAIVRAQADKIKIGHLTPLTGFLGAIGSYAQLAYGTRQFFSADRWGMTCEAAAFTDPFYSPGSDFIALENDYLTDLIRRDVAGEIEERMAVAPCWLEVAHIRLVGGLEPLDENIERDVPTDRFQVAARAP